MSDSDGAFARLIVEEGLARPDQVKDCLRLQAELASAGVSPLPRLGELLVRKGYLTPAQLDRTMRLSLTKALTASQESDAPEGERIGKYVKSKKLGEGGMGEVWKAWDMELRRWVALKFLKGRDAEELARFKREAQTAGHLNHPNIAAIYEAHENYIAMQFVDGQTLATFPRQDVKLVVELVRDGALAVRRAHEEGIIHRDVKPENIMVEGKPKPRAKTTRREPGQPRSSGLRLYVMDFGLAKSLSVDSKLSVSGMIVGTPAYMSPEQARGGRVDARTHVYSLGATLYELLSNRPPFRSNDVYGLLNKVIEDEPRRLPGDLGTIVMKCLEKNPARRYPTALEFADDLSRWLAGEAIRAHPPSTAYRLRKFLWRRRAAAIPSVLAILVALVGGIWLLLGMRERGRLEERAEAEMSGRLTAQAREREVKLYARYEKELDVLRMKFYQPKFRLTPDEFGKYRGVEERIQGQMRETGESAQGWYLIGRVREVQADGPGTETAYDRALALDGGDAGSLLRKGRLLIERALIERFRAGTDESRRGEAVDRAREGAEWVRRGAEASRGEREMERDLAEAYAAVIQGSGYSVGPMLKKWQGEPFAEEFQLLEGRSGGPQALEDAAGEVLAQMPSWDRAWFWRAAARTKKGDLDGAIADYGEAIKINSRYADAYVNRGLAREKKGDLDGAIADYEKALEVAPANWPHRAKVEEALKSARKK